MIRRSNVEAVFAVGLACAASPAWAGPATEIDPVNKYAWAENIGWTNWADANGGLSGVRVEQTYLSGFIWAENVGWICVGDGPSDGFMYSNADGSDTGVNIVNAGTGELAGLAWGENIGWVNFGTTPTQGDQGARFDSLVGRFRGFAWAENVGWINLDDSKHFVSVFTCPPDLNGSGDVNAQDLALLLSFWGQSGPADLNGSGGVNAQDLALLLSFWGPCD